MSVWKEGKDNGFGQQESQAGRQKDRQTDRQTGRESQIDGEAETQTGGAADLRPLKSCFDLSSR